MENRPLSESKKKIQANDENIDEDAPTKKKKKVLFGLKVNSDKNTKKKRRFVHILQHLLLSLKSVLNVK